MADFLTAGGGAANALDEILNRKKAEQRQALLDQLATQRENRADELQRQAAKDLEYNREDQRVSRVFENMLPGEVDPITAALLKNHGYGSALEDRTIEGNVQPQGETADTRDPSRQAVWMDGGARYQMAREAAKERASQATEAQKARDFAAVENDKRDQTNRLEMQHNALAQAKMIADNNLQVRKDAVEDKKQAAEAEKGQKLQTVRNMASKQLETISELLDDKDQLQPGVSEISGNMRLPEFISSRTGNIPFIAPHAADKQAAFNQLKSELVLGIIAEMKSQSRTGATGFGQLSNKEGELLATAAAQLSQAQSEPALRQELAKIKRDLMLIMKDPVTYTYDSNGNLVK